MKAPKKIIMFFMLIISIILVVVLSINQYVQSVGQQQIVAIDVAPKTDAIIVLGAYVFPDGTVSHILNDRLSVAHELYQKDKAPKIIVSGDHGRKDYDEVNAMKSFLRQRMVPDEDVFMDHAGFSTYESMYRARDIFQVRKVIIVTQEYHLMRAIFIAKELGLEAYGVASDRQRYLKVPIYQLREIAARNKDFFTAKLLQPKPKYLGEVIPVSGDGRLTNDKID